MEPAPRHHPVTVAHQRALLLLGEAVRSRRLALGLTVKELAGRAGLSQRFLGLVEAGEGNPALTRLMDLAAALGCPLTDMVGGLAGPPHVVALLGLRGAGKSSVGRVLARRLKAPFVEVDARVEQQAGLRLAEIFALHGEDYYRRLEAVVLEQLLASPAPCVLATGGGVVTNPPAMDLLRNAAIKVWLHAPVELHWQRVVAQGDRRPMAGIPQARAELDAIYGQRAPLYRRAADVVVDTLGLQVPQVVDQLVQALARAQSIGSARA